MDVACGQYGTVLADLVSGVNNGRLNFQDSSKLSSSNGTFIFSLTPLYFHVSFVKYKIQDFAMKSRILKFRKDGSTRKGSIVKNDLIMLSLFILKYLFCLAEPGGLYVGKRYAVYL